LCYPFEVIMRLGALERILRSALPTAVVFCGLFAATGAFPQPPPKLPSSCSALTLKAGSLEQSLAELGREKGFEVIFGSPKAADLSIQGGALEGPTCVAALAHFLEGRNLSFALSEGPGGSIRKVLVIDFKAKLDGPENPARPEVAPLPQQAADSEILAEPVGEPVALKAEGPDMDDTIDLGDGMKMFRVAPPYVAISPGLIPPNAAVAGPQVGGETHYGDPAGQENAVITPTLKPPSASPPVRPRTPSALFPGALPPNVVVPAPTPTPHR